MLEFLILFAAVCNYLSYLIVSIYSILLFNLSEKEKSRAKQDKHEQKNTQAYQ